MEIIKTAKVTFDFMVTMATVYIKELWNAHQKIPHEILRKSHEIFIGNTTLVLEELMKNCMSILWKW